MKSNQIIKALLLFALSVFTLSSCKKTEIGTVGGSNDLDHAMAKKQSQSSTFICPGSIEENGKSKNGAFVKTTIPGQLPNMIGVQGTNDFSKPQSNGKWKSNNKYTSLQQSLLYYNSSGNVICSCAYDANGALTAIADFLLINNVIIRCEGVLQVYVSFAINGLPAEVVSFDIERSNSASGPFSIISTQAYTGNIDYDLVDNSPILDGSGNVASSNYYRVAAKDVNGDVVGYSEIKLAQKECVGIVDYLIINHTLITYDWYNPTGSGYEPANYISFSINGLPADVVSFDTERSGFVSGPFSTISNQQYTGNSDYDMYDTSPILDGSGDIALNNYYRIAAKDVNGAVVGYSEVKVALPE